MEKKELLRQLPKVDELLLREGIRPYLDQVSRSIIVESIREELEEVRREILNGAADSILEDGGISLAFLEARITSAILEKQRMNLRRVINGTGTILHTNLGRALIPESVREHIFEIASRYSNLEYDIQEGTRGSRHVHVEKAITQLTGTEAALVVNNNAAAVMLILNTVARGKEVVVSRGELVEIGGSFRIPEIMEQSGARLKEVGTTNKTHLRDYANAISDENTGALLKVHTSNYRILGFTEEVTLKELTVLGSDKEIPVIHDLGSGSLVELSKYGIYDEPSIMESVASGADIICFSGDKLLGGPQAGIIIGKKEWIDKMKKNPLTRAFRVDKLILAALEGTLQLYFSKEDALKKIPTLRMMTMTKEETRRKAEMIYAAIRNCDAFHVCLTEGASQIGGGSLPLHELPGWMLQIQHKTMTANEFETALRSLPVPIIARIHKDAVLLDVRTIEEDELSYVAAAIGRIG